MAKRKNTNFNLDDGVGLSKRTNYAILGSMLGITLCTGAVLASSRVNADDTVVDNVSIEVPIACSMGGVGMNSHTATLQNGIWSGASGSEYENGIGKTTLTTFCNDQNGFAIYAVGFTGETTSGGNNDKLVGTNTGLTIATGVYDQSTTTNSVWSMKVNKVVNPQTGDPITDSPERMTITNSFDNWHTVPTAYTQVASYKASTGSSATVAQSAGGLGAKVETTYAAYISNTQGADTYTGKVKYVMVHPYDHTAPTDELIMQNVSQWKDSIQPGQEVTAKDARDNKTYTVAKLADGNLWMTQNLDHDIVTDGTVTYDSSTTDLPANTTWLPERATYASNVTHWNDYNATTNPTGVNGLIHPESYDPGNLYWNGNALPTTSESCTAAGGTWKTNEFSSWCEDVNLTASIGDSHYHQGNYYNWTAAVAMNNSSDYTTGGTLIEQSICPAGWTLPRIGTGDDTFGALWSNEAYGFGESSINQTTNKNLWDTPLYSAASGYWYGELYNFGLDGYFWSPVVNDDYGTYDAFFDTDGNVNPDRGGSRYFGYSVRCVARPVASTVSYGTVEGPGFGGLSL